MEEWIFKGLIVVLAGWAIWGYINERTQRRKYGDEYMTAAEVERKCKVCHEKRDKERDREMSHVRELIEKDLQHGRKRFESMEKAQDRMAEAVIGLISKIDVLAEKVEAIRESKNPVGA